MMLLVLPILPVQLIAFDLVRSCRLNAVVGEGNQIELRLIAFIRRLWLRLHLWRILLLRLRLLLRRRAALHLVLLLRRVALLVTVILRRRGRRSVASVLSIGIVAVPVRIGIRVAVRIVAVAIIRIAAES